MKENSIQEKFTPEQAGDVGAEFQCLTFRMADETYGVDVLQVQEIRGWEPVTRVPNSADYVKGVLNLRGAIVPVYDLRTRFRLPHQDPSSDTVVIILNINDGAGIRSIGIVVDSVANVHDIHSSELRATPEFGMNVPTRFIQGLADLEDGMVMVLETSQLLESRVVDSGVMENAT